MSFRGHRPLPQMTGVLLVWKVLPDHWLFFKEINVNYADPKESCLGPWCVFHNGKPGLEKQDPPSLRP